MIFGYHVCKYQTRTIIVNKTFNYVSKLKETSNKSNRALFHTGSDAGILKSLLHFPILKVSCPAVAAFFSLTYGVCLLYIHSPRSL
jgi:hypothetical protein